MVTSISFAHGGGNDADQIALHAPLAGSPPVEGIWRADPVFGSPVASLAGPILVEDPSSELWPDAQGAQGGEGPISLYEWDLDEDGDGFVDLDDPECEGDACGDREAEAGRCGRGPEAALWVSLGALGHRLRNGCGR